MNIASVSQIRDAEQRAVAGGIAEYELMRRAGNGAAGIIEEFFPERKRTVILCGGGNNGGDALEVASRLSGKRVVYSLKPLEDFTGPAAFAAKALPENIEVTVAGTIGPDIFRPGDLIVDGLLGIGFTGSLREGVSSYIKSANASKCPVVSLDVPSGLNSDSGTVDEICIHADLTVTFGAVKQGLLLNDGPAYCGVLRSVDIGLSEVSSDDRAVTFEEAARLMPEWNSDVYKNLRGSLMIVAGSADYSGAAALSAHAALRCGAGIVRLATVDARKNIPYAVITRELKSENGVIPGDVWQECADWTELSTALAAGMGWGNASVELLAGALKFPGPVVLDADALNILARNPEIWNHRPQTVMTPHPGEAKRLAEAFGICESDRGKLASALAEKLGAVVLLKGKFSIAAAPGSPGAVILSGSPALATAGSGDVLAGIIGALLAMGNTPFEAAVLGASLHGRAGELSGNGSIADDLPEVLKKLLGKW